MPIARAGFRIAYRLAQAWWFFARPNVVGVKALLRDDGRILLVRHTYGNRRQWELPGGHALPGESAELAVRREMDEELGIDIEWRSIGSVAARTDRKHERVHCFVAPRPAAPLQLALAEIAEAQWFAIDALPSPMGDLSLRAVALVQDDRAGVDALS